MQNFKARQCTSEGNVSLEGVELFYVFSCLTVYQSVVVGCLWAAYSWPSDNNKVANVPSAVLDMIDVMRFFLLGA